MNKLNQVEQAAEKLIEHFGGQQATANALGVSQPAISNLLNGKHGASAVLALRAEQVAAGVVRAVDLCPRLAELFEAADRQAMPEVRQAS
ncbi:helix-turn-helix domain-containing protein [Microbulbifer sp. OS29]|uniref:Helix-turn-helix domain-containing protein n=1 Tax=Microbulbifer okhotskensis TaxID=2926617 RepID=A0A9X2EPT2_9GAMM|nr:YdaS family helix-turn-helix protein [Microbulbifer okhotskensis]MCO1336217.1 helix-turn-helix domain-containing protein [Microbulbifer okhotskensis]